MVVKGIPFLLHYLDDFFFAGPAHSHVCQHSLDTAVPLCSSLGLQSPSQSGWSATTLTFLGIEIDSVRLELRLPSEKLRRLRVLILEWSNKRSASKHQLQCFIGHLSHAASVVKPGRVFTRELIRTVGVPKRSFHLVRLNMHCRADIAWWAMFLSDWNGISLFPQMKPGPTAISDASGTWGCGAFMQDTKAWFQVQWPQDWGSVNTAIKELIPVVISAVVWGRWWKNTRIVFLSDNQAVVQALNSGSCQEAHLMHLLRTLFFFEAHFGFEHVAQHIPGRKNRGADALSRNRLCEFLSLYPQAPHSPVLVPPPLLALLFNPRLSWISPGWKALFQATLLAV